MSGHSLSPSAVISLPRVRKAQSAVNQLPLFYVDWSNGFVDASKWAFVVATNGTVTVSVSGGANGRNSFVDLLTTGSTASTAKLMSRKAFFPYNYGQTALTTFVERSVLEFVCRPADVASRIDNAAFLMGISTTQTATKATDNTAGFYAASDVLRAFVDRDGVETTSALTNTIDLTVQSTYRIEIDRINGTRFFVNNVLEATITTNQPSGKGGFYLVFHNANDTTSGNSILLGETRAWIEDVI